MKYASTAKSHLSLQEAMQNTAEYDADGMHGEKEKQNKKLIKNK